MLQCCKYPSAIYYPVKQAETGFNSHAIKLLSLTPSISGPASHFYFEVNSETIPASHNGTFYEELFKWNAFATWLK